MSNLVTDVPKNENYVKEIIKGVYGINLSEQEVAKLKVYLRYEIKGTLFNNIPEIYKIISANFTKPNRILIIPYINQGLECLNIQKI